MRGLFPPVKRVTKQMVKADGMLPAGQGSRDAVEPEMKWTVPATPLPEPSPLLMVPSDVASLRLPGDSTSRPVDKVQFAAS